MFPPSVLGLPDVAALLSVLAAPVTQPTLTPEAVVSFLGLGSLEQLVERATGWPALVIVFGYSFLIAFVLPGVSEVVLLTPLDFGLGFWPRMALLTFVSALGKAAGSVFAFHIGQEAKQSGPIVRWIERSRFDVIEWSQNWLVSLTKRYGYIGLAFALSIPFFPDTLSIYAFAVLEEDYWKFAAATFVGSVGRLAVTIALALTGATTLGLF